MKHFQTLLSKKVAFSRVAKFAILRYTKEDDTTKIINYHVLQYDTPHISMGIMSTQRNCIQQI